MFKMVEVTYMDMVYSNTPPPENVDSEQEELQKK